MKYIFLSLLIFLFIGCKSYNNIKQTPSIVGDIIDKNAWYDDMTNNVLEVNLSVETPNSLECKPWNDLNAAARPCTLDDVNHDTDPYDTYKPKIAVQFQTDDFIPADELPNATFKQKGKSTREALQKSYRLKFYKNIYYHKEHALQFDKHPFDYSRIRNKLAFDIFIEIPNFTSLKTRFVDLGIDLNSYGFYTEIEQVDKHYLLNRGWNEKDNIYKAQNFDFRYTSDLSLNENGKPKNPKKFDEIIEVKTGKKQTKLIAMLQALNKPMSDKEFEKFFNKYFNRANYITWMAINIITANRDTISQNFYLFNPLYSDTFYFLPWDYDGAGAPVDTYPKWQLALGTWWDIPLHKKFISIKKNREDIDAMVNYLRAHYFSDSNIKNKLDTYKPIIQAAITKQPDSDHLSFHTWQDDFNQLYNRAAENIAAYKKERSAPMPFWQTASYANPTLILGWDKAVDFENKKLIYNLKVADNYDLNNSFIDINISQNSQEDASGTYNYQKDIDLSAGKYYMKVIAYEESNTSNYQIAFDEYRIKMDHKAFGVLEFEVR